MRENIKKKKGHFLHGLIFQLISAYFLNFFGPLKDLSGR